MNHAIKACKTCIKGTYRKLQFKSCVFRPKRIKQGGDMLDLIRKFLSGDGLDDALVLFGLAGTDENELPT